ncbi:uncharacterized protein G2W53_019481 [Senna tora]|uniref:Uncharacterized protein n=1 Tax=Senna tora TaxID=362788 RepID=A0A834TU61_9FABA|nr:uncharacterized protein G2W53_019481 [Senna tora]
MARELKLDLYIFLAVHRPTGI